MKHLCDDLRQCAIRDIETIDAELRLQAAMRRSIREHGGESSSRQSATVDRPPRAWLPSACEGLSLANRFRS
jgi:hypothetical protein